MRYCTTHLAKLLGMIRLLGQCVAGRVPGYHISSLAARQSPRDKSPITQGVYKSSSSPDTVPPTRRLKRLKG
ncbi:uncharacterized protein LY79DRAFT_564798 [Colletotrichum navitas]|uniref:Secreted protein n=1 Tax=Colletotrichum navitas TaxID=681940 RepID=A0AAD8UZH2_9PEZI|nr:uncharacterized protein LY79DRAFT_564798 [Colletotrichum navitas]KAK1579260.1 hypothetical protein LY79DRAFT_564798 [Colletotrichum navitas]